MNSDGSRGIGWRGDQKAHQDQETVDKTVQDNAERFARALLPHLVSPPPRALGLPEGWRDSDEVLTPAPKTQPVAATPTASSGEGAEGDLASGGRVLIQVQSRELGQLSVVLDRSATGVRVMIGVADAHTAELMAPERQALLERLVGNGVRVDSLQIVGRSEFGTLLAAPRRMTSPRAFNAESPADSDDRKSRRRGSRKLNVVG